MIKLTIQFPAPDSVIIHIDGRLDAETLCELRRLADPISPASLSIDLTGLTSVDPKGRAYLIERRSAGARLSGGSLYITRLLEEVSSWNPASGD